MRRPLFVAAFLLGVLVVIPRLSVAAESVFIHLTANFQGRRCPGLCGL